jgi:SPP1 family predicted phage head-tail adaptor
LPLRRLSQVPPPAGGYTPIGAMTRQVTFFLPGERSTVDGTTGAPVAYGTSWAAIRALQGAELDKAQQIAQKVTHLVAVPYQPGVIESMTLQYEERFFQVIAIEDPDEMHIELRLYTMEIGQNAGQQS